MNCKDENYTNILKDEITQMKSLFAMHIRTEAIQSNKTIVKLTNVIDKLQRDDANLCELILKYESDFSDYDILKESIKKKEEFIAKLQEEKNILEEKFNNSEKELIEQREANIKLKQTSSQQETELQEQEKLQKEVNSLRQQIKKSEIEKDYHKKQNLNYTSLIKQLQNEAQDNQHSKEQMFGELGKQVKLMKNQLENCQNEYIQKLEKREQEIKNLERKNLMLQKKIEMSEDFDQIVSIKKKSPQSGSNKNRNPTQLQEDSDNSVESFDMNEAPKKEAPKKETPEKILKQITNKANQKTQKLQGSIQTSTKKKVKSKH